MGCLLVFEVFRAIKVLRNTQCRWPLTKDDLSRKKTFDGRRPLMEDQLWRKTTFYGRRPLMEDGLWRKMTFDKRRPLMEDDLSRKTTFDGRRPLTEDNIWWKVTFDRLWPLTEDGLWQKTTLMEDDLWWKGIRKKVRAKKNLNERKRRTFFLSNFFLQILLGSHRTKGGRQLIWKVVPNNVERNNKIA